MGPKVSSSFSIHEITQGYNMQPKFPHSEEKQVRSVQQAVQENGNNAREGRDDDPGSLRRYHIIIISGQKEKCEITKEALAVLSLSPLR